MTPNRSSSSTAPSWKATEGTLATYEKRGGQWRVVKPERCARNSATAASSVAISVAKEPAPHQPVFTRSSTASVANQIQAPNSTTSRLIATMLWTYNPRVPSTYNVFQDADRSWKSYGGYVEELWDMGYQSDYVAVLDYNLPEGPIRTGAKGVRRSSTPPDTRRGGGIFFTSITATRPPDVSR